MDEDFDARKKRRALELEAKKKKLEELRRLKKERQQRRSQVRVLPSRAVCWRARYMVWADVQARSTAEVEALLVGRGRVAGRFSGRGSEHCAVQL